MLYFVVEAFFNTVGQALADGSQVAANYQDLSADWQETGSSQ